MPGAFDPLRLRVSAHPASVGAHSEAEDAKARSLIEVSADHLESATAPTTDYVVANLIPLALVLLGGHGGAGKSILALIIAAHVAAGADFAGHLVRWGRVIFVSLEDPGELVRWRLRKIIEAYGLDAEAVAENLAILDGSIADAALIVERNDGGNRWMMQTAAMEELREAAALHGAALIVIDNASDAFDGSENDRRQVRAFMRALAQLGRDVGAAVLLLAHIDKAAARFGGNGNSYSGSTAWHNSARARLALVVDGQVVELRQEKNNLGPLAAPLHFRWSPQGVLKPADAAALAQAEADNPNIAADNATVIACMRVAGFNIPTARQGAHTAYSVLQTVPEFPSWAKKAREGRDRFWAAITRLERIGWISREEYRSTDRKPRERWVIAEGAPNEYRQPATWAKSAPGGALKDARA